MPIMIPKTEGLPTILAVARRLCGPDSSVTFNALARTDGSTASLELDAIQSVTGTIPWAACLMRAFMTL